MEAGLQYSFMSSKIKKKIIIIVQARMGSARLPGKILKEVRGRSLLDYQIERLRRVNGADDVIIATTVDSNNDPVVKLCEKINCLYFRGSEDDVLLRYYESAKEFNANYIVRINADCPLIDPRIVDKVINFFNINSNEFDYVSNILEPSYPIGLHTEIFSIEALKKANDNSKDAEEREHVTPYIYRNPDIFRLGSVVLDDNLSHFRWTVDYPEDFILIEKIIKGVYPNNPDFDMLDILEFLKNNPELTKINSKISKKQTL